MKWEVQQAVYNVLSTEFGVELSIYDGHPAVGATFPYITLGRISSTPSSTQDSDIDVMNIALNTWSRDTDKQECLQIMERIADVLHKQDIQIVGHQLIDGRIVTSECLIDEDGETLQGVQTLSLSVNKTV